MGKDVRDELDDMDYGKLSDVFAVEVAGWEMAHATHPIFGSFAYRVTEEFTDGYELAKFAASLDACLPYLAAHKGYVIQDHDHSGAVCVRIKATTRYGRTFTAAKGIAPTMAQAICLALIRAKRQTPTEVNP
tara:strand:- start:23 stop:418 length:396 start_codon:yes stop_codon:yes gene_type:complete